jgi:Ca-activated chloride channel homolog
MVSCRAQLHASAQLRAAAKPPGRQRGLNRQTNPHGGPTMNQSCRTRSALQILSAAAALTLLALWVPAAHAIGILVPRLPEFSPIRLGDAEIRTEIAGNIAKTRVVQEFFNPNPRQLEADFYFPVPRGADVTDFVLYMNGKPVKGEVIEKEKAREIYEGIVRRLKDPGLIEWVDYNLFKVRVFPVPPNGTQKIELEFAQPLEADQGLFKYTFPLKAPRSSAEREDAGARAKLSVEITSDEPIRTVYSPSHTVDTDLKDPRRVKVALASDRLGAAGDFVLYYDYSNKDVALSLLASRPSASEDGFFSLMLSPPAKADSASSAPTQVVFVIDTSGSMNDDNKIEQARRALAWCVAQLRDTDRFNIVRFSTAVDKFRDGLIPATKANVDEAKRYIEGLRATGGTNISGALKEAATLAQPSGKPDPATLVTTVVFITDGMPTIGVTDPKRITDELRDTAAGKLRVFAFGVGFDVNTKLLDGIADATRATSDYVKPGQDLEVPVSRFFDKVSRPAMTGLKLDMPGAGINDVYPAEMPDLFHGQQLTVFGRYKKAGATAIRLSGTLDGKPVEFTYEKTLPESEPKNEFVEKLWGTRKIAYLLDEIRRNGEKGELKDEVVKLARKYGVVTPYTSYLVVEDEKMLQDQRPVASPRRQQPPPPWASGSSRAAGGIRNDGAPSERKMATAAEPYYGEPASAVAGVAPVALSAESGREAVAAAQAIRTLKDVAKVEDNTLSSVRSAAGKTFRLENGIWVDAEIALSEAPALKIKLMSDAYFAAIRLNPVLKDILSIGDQIRVKLNGSVIEFGSEGKETLDPQDEKLLAP